MSLSEKDRDKRSHYRPEMQAINIPDRNLPYLRTLGRFYRPFGRGIAGFTSKRFLVLMYHSVGSTKHAVKPADFAAQMTFLNEHANVIDLVALIKGEGWRCERRLVCAITFDDGYMSVHDEAFPLLCRYRFPATVYITTSALRADQNSRSDESPYLLPGERMLSWSQCREMAVHDITIGSHLCHHLDLARLPATCAAAELKGSKFEIEDRLGKVCKHFAFPWGRYTHRMLDLVPECGYETAATVIHRPLAEPVDPLRIPRMNIGPGYTLDDFRAVLEGDWDYLGIIQAVKQPRRSRPRE